MRPTYLALRYYHLFTLAHPGQTHASPDNLLAERVLEFLDQHFAEPGPIRDWVIEVYQVLNDPAEAGIPPLSLEDAEGRFLDLLLRDTSMEYALFMNNLGKVGNDLGFKVPFLF